MRLTQTNLTERPVLRQLAFNGSLVLPAALAFAAAIPEASKGQERLGHEASRGSTLAQAVTTSVPAPEEDRTPSSRTSDDSPSRATNTALEGVVVTGSRITRNRTSGHDQPTPVTTLAAESLQAAAPNTIADALNQLPQFGRSSTGTTCCNAGSRGNFLNLRALGTNRVLVLLDGDRLTPTTETGSVDVNLLPELLLERVDVVTGGASATYGSEAVSGVVNYVIDKQFEGIKVLAQTGLSTYGDNRSVKYGIAGGRTFAAGRAHGILSYEHNEVDGILSIADRSYGYNGHFLAGNGSATAPYHVVLGARNVSATNGSVIVNSNSLPIPTASDPLAGIVFEPNGVTRNFVLGTPLSGSPTTYLGGDGYVYGAVTALAPLTTDKVYMRFSYDVTDDISLYVRANGADTHTFQNVLENGQRGSTSFTIFRENAFLPAAVAAQMDAAGVTSIRVGRQDNDFGLVANDYDTEMYEGSVGVEGRLGDAWNWQASYINGRTKLDGKYMNNAILDNLYAAADAVVDPSTGQVVCRVTLTHPGTFPGCVPINLFGHGSPSAEAIDYVTADVPQQVTNKQQVISASMQGDLFMLPAGTMTVAFGAEYRKQSLDATTSPLTYEPLQSLGVRGMPSSLCPTDATCRFGRLNQTTNFGSADASADVKEGFLETLIPLLQDAPFARRLEFNGAFRYTDYETSGGVNTWKVGLIYEPFTDLRFRATRSRDIRAPNLLELFAGPVVGQAPSLTDPVTGVFYAFVPTLSQGNPNLNPEEADTTTVGLVYQPSWLEGFMGSIDYYEIDINGALAPTNAQSTLVNCQAGDTEACSRISRDPVTGDLQQILIQQINLDSRAVSGIDLDLIYRRNIGAGKLGVRGVLTRMYDYTDTVGGLSTQFAGYQGFPHWRGNLSLTYELRNFSLFIQERYVGKVRRWTGSPGRSLFEIPEFGSVFYTDLTATLSLDARNRFEVYGTVNNLFNRKPPLNATNSNPGLAFPTDFNSGMYDIVGSYFAVGLNVTF